MTPNIEPALEKKEPKALKTNQGSFTIVPTQ